MPTNVHAYIHRDQNRLSTASTPSITTTRFHSRSPIRLEHRPKSEQYQSAFDTDVDSIGDSTTFSLVDDDIPPASASDAQQDWEQSNERSKSFNFIRHQAEPRVVPGLVPAFSQTQIRQTWPNSVTDTQRNASPGRNTRHSSHESQPSTPSRNRLLREQMRFQSEKSLRQDINSTPSSAADTNNERSLQSEEEDEESSSPTPRRRQPILMRGPIRLPTFEAAAPSFPFHRKRSHNATTHDAGDSSHQQLQPVHTKLEHEHQHDPNPFAEPSPLSHTKTNVSLTSSSEHSPSTNLDYDPETLASLPYADLLSQPFDSDPRSPSNPESPLPTTAEQIEAALEKIHQQVFDSAETQQQDPFQKFFAELDIDAHEIAGDVVMEKMAATLKTLKEIRREKRAAALELERVVSEREAKVRESGEALGRSMEWLRKQGRDVVRGPG